MCSKFIAILLIVTLGGVLSAPQAPAVVGGTVTATAPGIPGIGGISGSLSNSFANGYSSIFNAFRNGLSSVNSGLARAGGAVGSGLTRGMAAVGSEIQSGTGYVNRGIGYANQAAVGGIGLGAYAARGGIGLGTQAANQGIGFGERTAFQGLGFAQQSVGQGAGFLRNVASQTTGLTKNVGSAVGKGFGNIGLPSPISGVLTAPGSVAVSAPGAVAVSGPGAVAVSAPSAIAVSGSEAIPLSAAAQQVVPASGGFGLSSPSGSGGLFSRGPLSGNDPIQQLKGSLKDAASLGATAFGQTIRSSMASLGQGVSQLSDEYSGKARNLVTRSVGAFEEHPRKIEEAVIETEGVNSKILTTKENIGNLVGGIWRQPKPLVDTIREEEKYGNNGDKFETVGRAVVSSVSGFTGFVSKAINKPFSAFKDFTRSTSQKLNNFGGKLVGL